MMGASGRNGVAILQLPGLKTDLTGENTIYLLVVLKVAKRIFNTESQSEH